MTNVCDGFISLHAVIYKDVNFFGKLIATVNAKEVSGNGEARNLLEVHCYLNH